MAVKKKQILKSKKNKVIFGIVHINSTFNNTIVTVTDLYGNMDDEDLKKTIRDKARELFLNENWIMANTSGFNQG